MFGMFDCEFDVDSGMWQIISPSGHVIYEATSRDLVEAVYEELCLEMQEMEERSMCEVVW